MYNDTNPWWDKDDEFERSPKVSDSDSLPCYVKSLPELRNTFEASAKKSLLSVKRNKGGEYMGTTFFLWAGYWNCAKDSGVLEGDDADFLNMHT